MTSGNGLKRLDLPREYEDLTELLHADIAAIAGALTDRAVERLWLSRGDAKRLRLELWNELVAAVDRSMETLTVECR